MSRWLLISDTQEPFGLNGGVKFAKSVQKEFRIPPENCIHVGDEIDAYFGGQWKKDPSVNFSAAEEIKVTKDRMREWYKAFPKMKVCISNHGLRWARKAFDAEIPEQMLRPYREIIEAPRDWVWKHEWRFTKTKHPFRVIHGMGYSGPSAARNAALDARINTVIGHVHSHAGIAYIHGNGMDKMIWGFNVGCLIDTDAFAFHYAKYNRQKAILGLGVVVDDGKTPIFVPYA